MDDQFRNICCWGNLKELKRYDKQKINEEVLEQAISFMAWKLVEIEVWETEDENQNLQTLNGFKNRSMKIGECINFLCTQYPILMHNLHKLRPLKVLNNTSTYSRITKQQTFSN